MDAHVNAFKAGALLRRAKIGMKLLFTGANDNIRLGVVTKDGTVRGEVELRFDFDTVPMTIMGAFCTDYIGVELLNADDSLVVGVEGDVRKRDREPNNIVEFANHYREVLGYEHIIKIKQHPNLKVDNEVREVVDAWIKKADIAAPNEARCPWVGAVWALTAGPDPKPSFKLAHKQPLEDLMRHQLTPLTATLLRDMIVAMEGVVEAFGELLRPYYPMGATERPADFSTRVPVPQLRLLLILIRTFDQVADKFWYFAAVSLLKPEKLKTYLAAVTKNRLDMYTKAETFVDHQALFEAGVPCGQELVTVGLPRERTGGEFRASTRFSNFKTRQDKRRKNLTLKPVRDKKWFIENYRQLSTSEKEAAIKALEKQNGEKYPYPR